MSKYLYLKIKEIITETADTKTIVFWQPIHQAVKYDAGQFLTVIVEIDGQKHRRSYSMSSSPREAQLAITVKKLHNGLVSEYLCNQAQVGDILELQEPAGHFTVIPQENKSENYVFFAGGSGITPVFSMIKTLLPIEKNSQVFLIYASRSEQDIIFVKQLAELELKYADQFKIVHVLTQPSYTWTGYKTRINQASTVIFLKQDLQINIAKAHYYLCGPEAMMQQIQQALHLFDVAQSQIHQEHFTKTIHVDHVAETIDNSPKTYQITINYEGKSYPLAVKPQETILEAALSADIDLPYSCQAGMCTACMGKCTQGSVVMDEEDGLTDAEIAKGYVLTCVAHPSSEGVVVEID